VKLSDFLLRRISQVFTRKEKLRALEKQPDFMRLE